MRYSFSANVHYPEQTDVETPAFDDLTLNQVSNMVAALLEAEPDAVAYNIFVTTHK